MKFSLLPRESRFFELLRKGTENLQEVAGQLLEMVEKFDNIDSRWQEIKRLEEAGDAAIHEIMRQLHRTFVTPLDREDIALLAERIDDVVDAVEEAARDMLDYRISKPTPAAAHLALIISQQAYQLHQAISLLHFRGSKLNRILPYCVELNRLENEADHVTTKAIAELFGNEYSPVDIIKWREIYNQLEEATDRAEDAANILEGVVLKNA